MPELLHNFWFLVAVVVIVCSVTATIAQAWQKVRRGEQEMALKQEMLRRGLSVEEIERLLRAGTRTQDTPPASPDEKALEKLIECLGEHGASGRVVEQVLAAVRSADPALRRPLCRAVKAVLENSSLEGEAKDEQVLAVVRGLTSADRPAAVEEVPPAAGADPAKIDDMFQSARPMT
jgi:hypothetical protein